MKYFRSILGRYTPAALPNFKICLIVFSVAYSYNFSSLKKDPHFPMEQADKEGGGGGVGRSNHFQRHKSSQISAF